MEGPYLLDWVSATFHDLFRIHCLGMDIHCNPNILLIDHEVPNNLTKTSLLPKRTSFALCQIVGMNDVLKHDNIKDVRSSFTLDRVGSDDLHGF
jgi:hypothetical protein